MNLEQCVLVIDVETTGFDPFRNACVELGGVLLDEALLPVREFSSLIKPWPGAEISEEAMAVNGISMTDLAKAPEPEEVARLFASQMCIGEKLPLLGGWNVWFDVGFLQQLYLRGGQPWPFRHRFVDVQSIISFHMKLAAVSQGSAIEKYFGERQSHRALADAKHTARLLRWQALHLFGH